MMSSALEYKSKLRVLDLFSGIGGFSLGLQATNGFETIAFCEIDSFCQKVLKKHWPIVPLFEDIRSIAQKEIDGLGQIDCITAGFPCQPYSCAGKRKGKEDERYMWPELLRVIRLVRPQFVLLENVPGLLSIDRGTIFGGILADLAASGYDAEWNIVSAASVGAPHLRKRVFIIARNVAYTEGRRCGFRASQDIGAICGEGDALSNGGEVLADTHGEPIKSPLGNLGREQAVVEAVKGIEEPGCIGNAPGKMADTDRISLQPGREAGYMACQSGEAEGEACERQRGRDAIDDSGSTICGTTIKGLQNGTIFSMGRPGQIKEPERSDWWAVEPELGRVAHGIPSRVDRLSSLGNAIVPQCAEYVGQCILAEIAIYRPCG